MKYDELIKLKNRKPFKICDVIVYAVLTATIILSLVFFVFLPEKSLAEGFKIDCAGKTVFTFIYSSEEYSVIDFEDRINVEKNGCIYTITVYSDAEKQDYNIISADVVKREVRVTESNCSLRKDCVFSPAVSGSGAIVCVPHDIKIYPLNNGIEQPSTGWLSGATI